MEIEPLRKAFLASTVRVVAREGLVKATTKAIAADAKLNESYIYKCFASKDEMLAEALFIRDERLAAVLHETLPVMRNTNLTWHDRAYALFRRCWDYILQDRTDCAFYIHYYYSVTGLGSNYAAHMKNFETLIEAMKPSFKEGTYMEALFHQLFSTLLFYASWVIDGKLEETEENVHWAFEQIYSFIAPNVRPELLEEKA